MVEKAPSLQVKNQSRRTLLLAGLTGVGAFVASKFLSNFTFDPGSKVVQRAEFQNYLFEETGDEITLREKGGEVIVVVDKASFRE